LNLNHARVGLSKALNSVARSTWSRRARPTTSGGIDQAYRSGDVSYPFWANPIPKFIANQGGTTPADLSYVATLPLGDYSFDLRGSIGRYTGQDGFQQSAEEVIFSLPNGLQGYVLFGAWNQRRVDPFTNIVRDPRIVRGLFRKARPLERQAWAAEPTSDQALPPVPATITASSSSTR
jgi:hypothetical protein